MSILNSHRMNFFGGIEVDVSLPNNAEVYPTLPGSKEKPFSVFNSKTSSMSDDVLQNNITDDEIIKLLREPAVKPDGEQYFTQGGWNIYGQHSVVTNNVQVRSAGLPGQVSEQSPLAAFPVYLLGSVNPESGQTGVSSPVMVDLNPLGSTYSQIVLGGLLVGTMDKPLLYIEADRICGNVGNSQGGLSLKILQGADNSPGSSNFAGTWQVTFPITDPIRQASGKTGNSQADKAIQDMLNTPGATGIVLNFSFFEMCPKDKTAAVRASYYSNQDERNPSVGRMIGTIALAFAGETEQNPDGRLLLNQVLNTERGNQFAPAYAETVEVPKNGDHFLSVNMSLAFLQQQFRQVRDGYASDTLDPAIDFGELTVTAGNQSAQHTPDYVNYYKFGGIIDIPLNSAQQNACTNDRLTISGGKTVGNRSLLLDEVVYRIYSGDVDIYIGDQSGDNVTITLQVRYLGGPVDKEMAINAGIQDSDTTSDNSYLDLSQNTITVKAGSTSVAYTLKVAEKMDDVAGFDDVIFVFGDGVQVVNTRKYQYTDFNITKGATVTWDDAYTYALRYHYLNFPGMSTVFPLNRAETIKNHRDGIKARMSSQYWPTTLYMPIVRSMSPSQVRLINAYAFNTPWDPDAEI